MGEQRTRKHLGTNAFCMALALLYHTATPIPRPLHPSLLQQGCVLLEAGMTSAGAGALMNLLVQETHLPVGLLRKKLPHTQVIQTPLPGHCSTVCPTKPKSKNH